MQRVDFEQFQFSKFGEDRSNKPSKDFKESTKLFQIRLQFQILAKPVILILSYAMISTQGRLVERDRTHLLSRLSSELFYSRYDFQHSSDYLSFQQWFIQYLSVMETPARTTHEDRIKKLRSIIMCPANVRSVGMICVGNHTAVYAFWLTSLSFSLSKHSLCPSHLRKQQ